LSPSKCVLVAVDAPIFERLTYFAPDTLSDKIQRGSLVNVPLGRRQAIGVVVGEAQFDPALKMKEVSSLDEDHLPLHESFVSWLEWLSSYYHHPMGQVMSLAFPPLSKHSKRKSKRPPVIKEMESTEAPKMTPEQQKCFEEISSTSGFDVHLLHGVTGSGKTEVYLRLLADVIESGKRGLVLVPEIALTPQLVDRFAKRFGEKVAVIHSQLTDRERTNQWWQMADGQKSILVGARSALFCPIENLGIIIVDEEHEPSYKQDEKLKYHGRDAAVMLAKSAKCKIILGSATPSLETWKNAQEGRYKLHQMHMRVGNRSLPEVHVVDMRLEKDAEREDGHRYVRPDKPTWMSHFLLEKLEETYANKKQSALFLNRRGIAPVVLCEGCGHTIECPNCDISLTLHAHSHLVCHYCDYQIRLMAKCPDCHEGELKPLGLGTEAVENDIRRLFPEAKIARADRDEISNRLEMEEMVFAMERGEIDILIGTQMIAKGLDFPNLKTVGLVLADVGFNLPDFRATERSFQLITQVSGRAGRHIVEGEAPGQVVVQTYNHEHPSITFAVNNDYEGFANYELATRKLLNYPPYGKLCSIRIQSRNLADAESHARLIARIGGQLKEKFSAYNEIEVLGPAESPLAKLRGQFRFHILIKASSHLVLNKFFNQLLSTIVQTPSSVKVSVDVDPISLL
jgi:primosomal protein N' (replication factor Y) (superfamily II helicase)